MIRVLIADDHAIVREGLISALSLENDIDIVGQAANGREAIEKATELQPDIIIMDISMPGCNGLEATATLANQLPQTRVLILTVSDREEDLFQAIRFGARGYLLKSASINDIVTSIRQVVAGEAILSSYVATRLLNELCHERSQNAPLSQREMEVLRLVGEGLTNRQIAERLVVTESTAKTYLQRIMDKLHLQSKSEAMSYALRRGLVARKN